MAYGMLIASLAKNLFGFLSSGLLLKSSFKFGIWDESKLIIDQILIYMDSSNV